MAAYRAILSRRDLPPSFPENTAKPVVDFHHQVVAHAGFAKAKGRPTWPLLRLSKTNFKKVILAR